MSRLACAIAIAHPNIALVKYWGKRDTALNLPAVGSLSITLDRLTTRTEVQLDPELAADEVTLDDKSDVPAARRVSECLGLLRELAGSDCPVRVTTANDFPTAAGLASSASGFAALVVAAAAAFGLEISPAKLSELARRGSGSAARSIFGGFVRLDHGVRADGADSIARPLLAPTEWPLEVVIALTTLGPKSVSSSAGMLQNARTAPYYEAWLSGSETDLEIAARAVSARDFDALADISEHSCLKMHGLMLAGQPGLLYWLGATVECLHRIRALRASGTPVFFTVDAGPQVKAVCLPEATATVAAALAEVPGVQAVLTTGLGEGAHLIDNPI